MRRKRKTKILATLGPSSSTPEQIQALFEAGADAFRINMSHTSHAGLAELHRYVRGLEAKVGRPIGILTDLQGPKIRLGTLAGVREVHIGDKVHLVRMAASDNPTDIPIPHPEVFAALQAGETILIDDGKIKLRVTDADKEWADAVVETAGTLKDKKGVNLPDTILPIHAMTPKDRSDLDAALNLGVDWVALSFVQRPDDVAEMKKIVAGRAGGLAKIEKPKAVEWLEDILDLSDALMVARGDLGVELPVQQVPGKQKYITRAAAQSGQTGGRRHPDAGIDDYRASADPCRSIRCGNGRLRRRRCRDALRGIRCGPVPCGSRLDDGQDRHHGGKRSALRLHYRSTAQQAGIHHGRRHYGCGARGDAHHQCPRHRVLDEIGRHRS